MQVAHCPAGSAALASHRGASLFARLQFIAAQRDNALFTFYEARRPACRFVGSQRLWLLAMTTRKMHHHFRETHWLSARASVINGDRHKFLKRELHIMRLLLVGCRVAEVVHAEVALGQKPRTRIARIWPGINIWAVFVQSRCSRGKVGVAFLRTVPMTRGEWTSRVVTNCRFYGLSPRLCQWHICLPAHVVIRWKLKSSFERWLETFYSLLFATGLYKLNLKEFE